MNNKIISINSRGFTLIELLCSIVIIGLVTYVTVNAINSTMSINEENAYDVLKSNIISSAALYINECENGLIECEHDYVWNNNKTNFLASKLIKHNYFKSGELVNPITNKDLSFCLLINANVNNNKVINISVDDSNC